MIQEDTTNDTPFALTSRTESRKNRKTLPQPQPPCTKDYIIVLLGDKAPECITWAEQNNILLIHKDAPERCQKDAERIITKWEKAMANKAFWETRIQTEIPQLETNNPVTIGMLHEHLTKLLALHPDVANVSVEHEQCCGWFEVCEVLFHVEKNILRIS